jgi:hypothetical protein
MQLVKRLQLSIPFTSLTVHQQQLLSSNCCTAVGMQHNMEPNPSRQPIDQ